MTTTVIILGGTGHLATRRLLPSLAATHFGATVSVIAVGRTDYTTEGYLDALPTPENLDAERWQRFTQSITYVQADPASKRGFAPVAKEVGLGNRIIYFALPPEAVPAAIEAVKRAGLHQPEDGRVTLVLEKPFGMDATSAQALYAQLEGIPDSQIFCVDHYLAKETVANLLTFRFGNAMFEPLWCADYIKEIQITVAETEGIEDRFDTYKALGASLDQLQSHILQLVALTCMEEPDSWSPEAIDSAKTELLRHVTANPERTVRGRYPLDSAMIEQMGNQETYIATEFSIDHSRWRGVPIYVRTGRALPARMTDITVFFKPAASALFGTATHTNALTFRIQPDESIFMSLAVRNPEQSGKLSTARMTFCYHDSFRVSPDAYTRVLEAIEQGDATVAVSRAQIMEAWRIIDALDAKSRPVEEYAAGSWGPESSHSLLFSTKSLWHVTEGDVCNGVTLQGS